MSPQNKNKFIICGKFDNTTEWCFLSRKNKKTTRVLAEAKKHIVHTTNIAALSIEKKEFWFNERRYDLNSFICKAIDLNIKHLLVLTEKERLYILENLTTHRFNINSLEESLPFFSNIKYRSCARTNYNVLNKHLRKLNQLNINPTNLSTDLATKHQRYVARKIHHKNNYDSAFFFAYKEPYQEVFKLKEERANRKVIALDFNSMYIDSMKGAFCDPASIEYKNLRNTPVDYNNLNTGIYRVKLISAKHNFIYHYHPFRYKSLGHSSYFHLKESDGIETVLNDKEIVYFSRFFERTEIIEGFVSNSVIQHPLITKGLNQYSERLYHRRRGDKLKENLCNLSMQHMHSSTNQRRYITKFFRSLDDIRVFLSNEFQINSLDLDDNSLINFLSNSKHFNLSKSAEKYKLIHLNIKHPGNVFSLSSQVVSNARLKVMKTIERLITQPSVEICYVNVDSIHISIQQDLVNEFLRKNNDIISNELGKLKIEAIADQGYWFDVGRYWLFKDKEVILHKNKGFNKHYSSKPFIFNRRTVSLTNTDSFTHLNSRIISLEKDLTYHKKLIINSKHHFSFVRFSFDEIRDLTAANNTEAYERLRSTSHKLNLLNTISKKNLV